MVTIVIFINIIMRNIVAIVRFTDVIMRYKVTIMRNGENCEILKCN